MKARNLPVDTLLKFEPGDGRILLHRGRVLAVNADGLGALRKDLITSLGPERARGFLLRYGWACGYHDALELRDLYPWDDASQWLRAAPLLHSLEGAARVRVERSRIDIERGQFHVEGTWLHSYEAEQHVRHFGLASEPVCWTLCGYAAGYGSACLGRRVVYREVSCVGAGDPVCRFVGKTLEAWGPDIEAELRLYEPDQFADQLEQAYARLRWQYERLRRSADIHEELTRLLLEGKGVIGLTRALSRRLAGPVAVEQADYRLLAVEPADTFRPPDGLTGPVGMAARSEKFAEAVRLLKAAREPCRLNPLNVAGLTTPWFCVPIRAGTQLLGYLSLLRAPNDEELEKLVLQRAATVYALELVRQQAVVEAEARILGDVLSTLLRGEFSDETAMARKLAGIGLEVGAPYRVVAVEWGPAADRNRKSAPGVPTADPHSPGHVNHIRQVVAEAVPGSLVVTQGDNLVLLIRLSASEEADRGRERLAKLWDRLVELAGPDVQLRAGAGGVCRHVRDYAAAYRQAREALELLRWLGRTGVMLLHEDLGAYGPLFHPQVRAQMAEWALRLLKPLLEYDARRHAQLIPTLQTFLRCNGSLAETAREAKLHLSGLKYRLSRIEQLLGINLSNMSDRLQIHVALLVARMAGLIS